MKSIIDSVSGAVEKLGNAFDKNFTSKEEVLEKVKEAQKTLLEAQKQVVLAEAKGNYLQRCWRPIMMLLFTYIIFHTVIIAPVLESFWSIPCTDVPLDEIWGILHFAISGYVVSRTGEKVIPKMTDVAQKIMDKRHDRRNRRQN